MKGMKRILIFSLAYYPRFVGGAEVAIKEITDRIPAQDIEFDMITLRFDRNLPITEKIGNVTIHRIGFSKINPSDDDLLRFPLYLAKVFYAPLAFWKAVRLDRKRRYDALWSMMSYMGFPALFFIKLYRKIPFVLSLQEGDSLDQVVGRKRIRSVSGLYRSVFKKATVVQTISRYLADFAEKMGHAKDVEVVPNGVDLDIFSQRLTDTESFALKSKLNKKYTDTFLITTSRLVPKNAVNDIIMALTYLPVEVKLLILGNGFQENELKELVLKEGLQDRVHFLGYVPYKNIPPYLNVSDIFIRPSLSEGFGNSFVEAMAAEIPVIATPVGGIVDFLYDKKTGLFCNVHDPKSIAKAVEKILSNFDLRNTLVLNAKKMVGERYSWDLVAQKMRENVFDKVLKER